MIETCRPVTCRLCSSKIFLYNIDLGEFIFRVPFEWLSGRKHYCPKSYEVYTQQEQQYRFKTQLHPQKASVTTT
jgi:hypothetical protein